jgi:putative hydrolase of the HAD superfamily
VSACEALLVDAFGTLIALREPAARTYARIAARSGIARSPQEIAQALRDARIAPPRLDGVPLGEIPTREREGWRAVVRAVLGDAAADGPCFDALWQHFATGAAWRVLDGAIDAMDTARAAGVRVGVLSNMDARLTGVLRDLGLAEHLDGIFLPSTTGLAKPDPRAYLAAVLGLAARAERTVYIGDHEEDCVAPARRAGLRALRYAPKAPPAPDLLTAWSELPRAIGLAGAQSIA